MSKMQVEKQLENHRDFQISDFQLAFWKSESWKSHVSEMQVESRKVGNPHAFAQPHVSNMQVESPSCASPCVEYASRKSKLKIGKLETVGWKTAQVSGQIVGVAPSWSQRREWSGIRPFGIFVGGRGVDDTSVLSGRAQEGPHGSTETTQIIQARSHTMQAFLKNPRTPHADPAIVTNL